MKPRLFVLLLCLALPSCMTGCAGTAASEPDPFTLFVNKEFGLNDPNAELSRKLDGIKADLAKLKELKGDNAQ